MNEVDVPSERGATEPPKEERHTENQPRPGSQVADNAVSVRESEVAEVRRRYDVDLDSTPANCCHGIGNKTTGRVPWAARIGRRENQDLQTTKYDRRVRGRLPSTFPAVAGWILVTALALMLLARLPGAFHSLNNAAKAAVGRNELGGALATADSISVNDDFVREAFQLVPKNASYAVVLPTNEPAIEKTDNVNPITFDGVAGLFGDYLLPRRQLAAPAVGSYVLCFYCDQGALGKQHVRWLTPPANGGRIGYVGR